MPENNILFFTEMPGFVLRDKTIIRAWLNEVVAKEKCQLETLTFVFTTDKAVLEINRQYLDHDYYTDVITFDYCHTEKRKKFIAGDIFISIDRVAENAKKGNENLKTELRRVMVHGLLHLCGHRDKSEKEERAMREREDFYLNLPILKKQNT